MINITERIICSELEKKYENITFDRKYSKDIRKNIILFIKYDLNNFLNSKKELSGINLFEEGILFLGKNFEFLTSNKIDFNSIDIIKDEYLNLNKEAILAAINPIYFKMNLVPDCLKNQKQIDNSLNFLFYSSFMFLVDQLYNETGKIIRLKNINFSEIRRSDFDPIILFNKFLKKDIPIELIEKIEEENFIEYFQIACALIYNYFDNDFSNSHIAFRKNKENRDMKNNINNVIEYISENCFEFKDKNKYLKTKKDTTNYRKYLNENILEELAFYLINNFDYKNNTKELKEFLNYKIN